MILFDTEIKQTLDLFNNYSLIPLNITNNLLEDVGKNNMVFAKEAAYELGSNISVSFELPSSTNFITKDEILLLGKDLNEIKTDTTFARITFLNIKDDKLNGDELYDRLERIKFTKYRVSPGGYMLRTTSGNREKIRVSKDVSKCSSFSQIGSAYLKAYKQMPFVNFVKIIFVTEDCDIFDSLINIGEKKVKITEAIDHILKGMLTNDCGSCSVKELCDEVEGMRQIHKGE